MGVISADTSSEKAEQEYAWLYRTYCIQQRFDVIIERYGVSSSWDIAEHLPDYRVRANFYLFIGMALEYYDLPGWAKALGKAFVIATKYIDLPLISNQCTSMLQLRILKYKNYNSNSIFRQYQKRLQDIAENCLRIEKNINSQVLFSLYSRLSSVLVSPNWFAHLLSSKEWKILALQRRGFDLVTQINFTICDIMGSAQLGRARLQSHLQYQLGALREMLLEYSGDLEVDYLLRKAQASVLSKEYDVAFRSIHEAQEQQLQDYVSIRQEAHGVYQALNVALVDRGLPWVDVYEISDGSSRVQLLALRHTMERCLLDLPESVRRQLLPLRIPDDTLNYGVNGY